MACKFIETGPGQNLLLNIKEADQADNLFIGGDRKLVQYSVSQVKVIKDYDDIMTGMIYSMVQTSDKKCLFLSDSEGC
jgi:hypothetical protein